MGFRANVCNDNAVVELQDEGDNYVNIMIGDTCVAAFNEDGTFELANYVDASQVGNLKLVPGKDDGYGSPQTRARIFFEGEELVLPSEVAAAEKKASSKAKK